MRNLTKKQVVIFGLSALCVISVIFLIYKYEKEYMPYEKDHGPLSPVATLNFMLNSCTTKSEILSASVDKIYNQPINLPTTTETQTEPTVGSLTAQFNSSPCGKYYIIPSLTMIDPYSEPGVININISQILAKHVQGGILVRGAWDTNAQGVFTAIPSAESFVQLKNSDGAPTPYYQAGNIIYIFKTEINAKLSTQGVGLPTPMAISGADASTFVPGISTDLKWVAKDKSHVYVNGVFASEIDSQTVSVIPGSQSMFKDKNHVYEIVSTQTNSKGYDTTQYDSKTFSIIFPDNTGFSNFIYMKDKNGVYFGERKIIGADPNTFTVFTVPELSPGKGGYALYSYAKDNHAVYYSTENSTQIVPGADHQTFMPVNTGGIYTFYCGKDKNALYKGITIISDISVCSNNGSNSD